MIDAILSPLIHKFNDLATKEKWKGTETDVREGKKKIKACIRRNVCVQLVSQINYRRDAREVIAVEIYTCIYFTRETRLEYTFPYRPIEDRLRFTRGGGVSRLELLFMLLRILTVILCRSSRGIPIINAACCTVTQRGTRKKERNAGEGEEERPRATAIAASLELEILRFFVKRLSSPLRLHG